MRYLSSILLLVFFSGCSNVENPLLDFWETFEPFETDYNIRNLEQTDQFESIGVSKGTSTLQEASGLAYSRKNPGYLWTHQDKGNDNRIFLLDAASGETVAAYRIEGMRNRDWEDIEIGPGPVTGVDYLYLGDIGDNDQVYNNYTIYRFEEPVFEENHRGKVVDLEWEFEKILFNFPDKSHDTEALMVDPETRDIYLATKRDFWVMVFVAPFPQPIDQEFTLQYVGELSFRRALAGNVSEDGQELLLKNDEQIFYWKRNPGEHFSEMLSREPLGAPYNPVEPQGESICFDPMGGYFTLSEFSNAIIPELYHYQRK